MLMVRKKKASEMMTTGGYCDRDVKKGGKGDDEDRWVPLS